MAAAQTNDGPAVLNKEGACEGARAEFGLEDISEGADTVVVVIVLYSAAY